jgi:hypothetical protein
MGPRHCYGQGREDRLTTTRSPADRRGNPVASGRLCRARTGVLSLRLSGRVGCCCRCWPGGRELEFTVGQQLAASHYPHPLMSGMR